LVLLAALGLTAGCRTARPGTLAARRGDEIVAAGQFIHTGTPVVLWMDPGGYDAYRVERRFSPFDKSGWRDSAAEVKALTSPNRYGFRADALTEEEIERLRGGGWDLPTLQNRVDQFVLHFDACGTSRQCFKVLQDQRGLSVHFLLDLDGTIYQTLDLKERAWHATTSNTRSVGIEIANIGAFPPAETNAFRTWYTTNGKGTTFLSLPPSMGDGGIRTPGFVGRTVRPEPVHGRIQDKDLIQYDFTPEQYRALIKLTATLCTVFPKIRCDYPRDASGRLVPHKLPEAELKAYQGVLGHFHIQTDKVDPGPAFQWDYLIDHARRIIGRKAPAQAGAERKEGGS
jgi:N-acetyl-anhydromuramyl-L-alanine amidase AmpD